MTDAPDGKYHICAVTADRAYLGSCDFAEPRNSYFDVKNGQIVARKLALTLRRGTIVEITVDDPKGLIGDKGFHFRASVMGPTGEYRVATLTNKVTGQLVYSATMPRDLVASAQIDTRLRVTDTSSRLVLAKGDAATFIIVRGGPERVQVRLAVAVLDQDLSTRKN